MNNPLNTPGKVFDLALMNPNPTSSKTKDGPMYRVAFEVDRETWDCFMDAETKGMIIAAKACVVADAEGESIEGVATEVTLDDRSAGDPLKGAEQCRQAVLMCKHPNFQRFSRPFAISEIDFTPTEQSAKRFLLNYCGIGSRRELDHYADARVKFKSLCMTYSAWVEENVGK